MTTKPTTVDLVGLALRVERMHSDMHNLQLQSVRTQQDLSTSIQGLQQDLHKAVEKLGEITVIAERQSSDNQTIQRVWQSIEKLQALAVGANDRIDRLENKSARWAGVAVGFSIAATILSGSVGWFAAEYMQRVSGSISNLREEVRKVEIHLAGDKDRPYTR